MHNLTGSTTNYVNSVPVPDDGVDDDTALSLEPGFQQLADNIATEKTDRTAAVAAAIVTAEAYTDAETTRAEAVEADIRAHLTLQTATFNATAASAWTAPAGCTRVLLIMWGGGGGAGGGAHSDGTSSHWPVGGGGGGGAERVVTEVTVVPGTAYDVAIGAGGTAGSGGIPGTDGTDGGTTSFTTHGGSTLASATGGQKGRGGFINTTASNGTAPGGKPGIGDQPIAGSYADLLVFSSCPGCGGDGRDNKNFNGGTGSNQGGFAGGTGGTKGTDTGVTKGGGGGGGGGAGPGGAGGNGGSGGNGAFVGGGGGAGVAAGANTGAGGGAGGAGGTDSGGGGGTSGTSQNGGSGQLTICFVAQV